MEPARSARSTYPEIAANGALALIVVACSLLDRQLAAQAAAFENEGGFTERLYRVRAQRRQPASMPSTKSNQSTVHSLKSVAGVEKSGE